MSPTKRAQAVVKDFSDLQAWEDKYKKIIELGKGLERLPEEFRREEFKVKGCQSQVWLHGQLDNEGEVVFHADSDAIIVKGLVALLLRVYSKATPEDILDAKPDFLTEIGLAQNLSPSRANGLHSMIKQIKYYAAAFKALKEAKSLVGH